MSTLKEVKDTVAKYAGDSGMCADDPRLVGLINEARRVLYPLAEWEGTMEPICVTPLYGRIVLPARYEYAREAFTCNHRLEVINTWFTRLNDYGCYCGNRLGLTREPGRHVTFFDWGKSQDTRDCNPEGFLIRVRFGSDADRGVVIKFRGIGVRGEDVSLTRTLTKEDEDIDAAGGDRRMVKITHVIKPKTNSWIKVTAYDGANEFQIALYEGPDVNPQYTIYGKIDRPVVMKAKKRFRELSDDDFDEVEFPDDAIIHVLQALSFRESKNLVGYAAEMQAATAFLNKVEAGPRSSSTLPIRHTTQNRVTGLIA